MSQCIAHQRSLCVCVLGRIRTQNVSTLTEMPMYGEPLLASFLSRNMCEYFTFVMLKTRKINIKKMDFYDSSTAATTQFLRFEWANAFRSEPNHFHVYIFILSRKRFSFAIFRLHTDVSFFIVSSAINANKIAAAAATTPKKLLCKMIWKGQI